jgi:hypothetical protein
LDNSKYLELVDLVGAERAKSVVEIGAELQANQAEWLIKKAIPNGSFPDYVITESAEQRNLPILSGAPETEFIALPWQCEYCGSTNPGEALYCGQCGPSHCGAPRPGGDGPPRDSLQLREFGSFYVVEDEKTPLPEVRFYPDDWKTVERHSVSLPRHLEELKLELGRRILAAYQKTIKEVLSLC